MVSAANTEFVQHFNLIKYIPIVPSIIYIKAVLMKLCSNHGGPVFLRHDVQNAGA